MPLSRFAPFSMSTKNKSEPNLQLRPCQRAYLGESNARRLLKRSHLTKRVRNALDKENEEPILALHEEIALQAAALAVAAPFETQQTGYSVQCYATFAEDEMKRKQAEASQKEKLVLFNSINASRRVEGRGPLKLKPILNIIAQNLADMLYTEDQHSSEPVKPEAAVVVMSPGLRRVARLVSPPRMGALSCGEMWYGGKYKRHQYNLDSEIDRARPHPDDCPCRLRIVFETMVDSGWKTIGIGRGEDSRWVVELEE